MSGSEKRSVNVSEMEVDLSRIDVDNVDVSDIVDKSEIANREISTGSDPSPVPGSKESKRTKGC